jgi:hypothetical protein
LSKSQSLTALWLRRLGAPEFVDDLSTEEDSVFDA